MLNVDFTFLWTALNLLILYLFLRKFLFGRVGSYMEQRAQRISNDMQKGEDLKAEGETYRQKYVELLESAADEKQAILSEARQKAVKQADDVLADAKKEAARILQAAHEDAVREHERLISGLKTEVSSLALRAASKVIEANMDTDKNRMLVAEFLKNEGAA